MNKKKKGLILTVVALLGLVAITVGVTFAFFSYAKEGTKENTLTTGTITFLYTEVSGVGKGISIDDAYPISDEVGKVQTGEGKVFDFKVTSTTPSNASIPYEITARKKVVDNMLDEEAVRIYLTKVSGTDEDEILLDNYSNLDQTTRISENKYIEKTLYTDIVPENSANYEQAYRLRMWVDESIDFSPVKDENGNDTYPYNDKTFTITVNVYANAKVVTGEDMEEESKAEISNITVAGTELVKVENEDYDYETSLPNGTTQTTIDIETISEDATVEIERIDSLAFKESSIKRLSTKKTLELLPGNNYFKITVISTNGKIENEYTLKIEVKRGELLSNAIFNKYTTIYENPTLTTSSNNTSDHSGLYKSTATNLEEPTYYFRGNVDGNWVDFAGFTWRVVRINEDGTIRLIMQNGINNNTTYAYNPSTGGYTQMYYSNSNVKDGAKYLLDNWYKSVIVDKGYSNYVAIGKYYCEQAKIKITSHYTSGNTTMLVYNSYTPNFKCETDGNGKGLVESNVGLISYDELVHSGLYVGQTNKDNYLNKNNDFSFHTMSPAGVYPDNNSALRWYYSSTGSKIGDDYVSANLRLRPVINLKTDVTVTGTGDSNNHWIVQ